MPKRLNASGKLIYLFTSLFPIYLYWVYFFYNQGVNLSFDSLSTPQGIGILIATVLCILSPTIFYCILVKRGKFQDGEIDVKVSKKSTKYLLRLVGSLAPFIIFIIDKTSTEIKIVASGMFIVLGAIIIFKDEAGILYNPFFFKYQVLEITSKKRGNIWLIMNKKNITKFIKIKQLDKRVFIQWN